MERLMFYNPVCDTTTSLNTIYTSLFLNYSLI